VLLAVCETKAVETVVRNGESDLGEKALHCHCSYVGFRFTGEKVTKKCNVIVNRLLKCIYLFIYRSDMFRLFPSHHQGACYTAQRMNSVYISKIQFTLVFLSFSLPFVKIE
jgi:hypothetical protein